MGKKITLLIIFVALICFLNTSKAIANPMFNSSQGKEFIIAIPPNEIANFSINSLEIYVTATENANLTLYLPDGSKIPKTVKANSITTFSSVFGDLGWSLEIRDSERALNQSIRLVSDFPVSVYVLNSKPNTSDGYMAIPVTSWGKEYYHCSYYDFLEYGPWAGGFIILASEDNTMVDVELNGIGYAKTDKGSRLGTKFQFPLKKGQVYMFRGDAKTRGSFDLSGSKIYADKPIGLISFHERTMIPSYNLFNGRNHLCEMMQPVSAWGKEFVTYQLKRDSNQGDFFRVMSSEANTVVNLAYFDPITLNMIDSKEIKLSKPGEFFEFKEIAANSSNKEKSITGVAFWTSNKPVQLLQYSYSAEWDGNAIFDPFMIIVSPTDQFANYSIFQTPSNKTFSTNFVQLIIKHDTSKTNFDDVLNLALDGKTMKSIDPAILKKNIPGTPYYWANISVTPGSHTVIGDKDSKFGGIVYGFSNFDSYGWPAVILNNNLSQIDTMKPEIKFVENETKTTLNVTDNKFDTQKGLIDQGIYQITKKLVNCQIDFDEDELIKPISSLNLNVELIDKFKEGSFDITFFDKYGNFSVINKTINNSEFKIELSNQSLNFGKIYLSEKKELKTYFKNKSKYPVKIKSAYLSSYTDFSFKTQYLDNKIVNSLDSIPIELIYNPTNTASNENDFDLDTLVVETEYKTLRILLAGFCLGLSNVKEEQKGLEISYFANKSIKVNIDNIDLKNEFEIFDIEGNMLLSISSFKSNENNLDISNFVNGAYILKIKNSKWLYNYKFIINK